MRSLLCHLVGLSALLVATMADSYNLTVLYGTDPTNRQYLELRCWYGDGHVYVGHTVPPEVKAAFNFTVPNVRADLLYISPTSGDFGSSIYTTATTQQQQAALASLPDPTFLVANDTSGAFEPLRFTHSGVGVGAGDIAFWARYEVLLLGLQDSGNLASNFYLGATSVDDTYIVMWKNSGAPAPATSGPGFAGQAVEIYTSIA